MSVYNWPLMKNTISLGDRLKLAKFVLTADRFTPGKEEKNFDGIITSGFINQHYLKQTIFVIYYKYCFK